MARIIAQLGGTGVSSGRAQATVWAQQAGAAASWLRRADLQAGFSDSFTGSGNSAGAGVACGAGQRIDCRLSDAGVAQW